MKRKYNIVVEKTDTGWSAYVEELPVYTTGTTLSTTLVNLGEAIDLYHSELIKTINPPY